MTDSNRATEFLVESTQNIIESIRSVSKYKNCSKNKILKPWITSSILNCIRRRETMYDKARKFSTVAFYMDMYKRYRNTVKCLLNDCKNKYYLDKLRMHSGDLKRTWNFINSEFRGKEKASSIDITRIEECKIFADDFDKLNCVNEHFVKAGKL